MTTHPDLLIRLGPAFVGAALQVALRALPELATLEFPGTGGRVQLSSPHAIEVDRDRVRFTLQLEHRARTGVEATTRSERFELQARLAWTGEQLWLREATLLGTGASLLQAWGHEAGDRELADRVAAALRDTWAVPLARTPLRPPRPAWPLTLAVTGTGRGRTEAPPELPPDSLAASEAGLRRLAAHLRGAALGAHRVRTLTPRLDEGGLHLVIGSDGPSGTVTVHVEAGTLRLDGPDALTEPLTALLLLHGVDLHAGVLRVEVAVRGGDELHDLVHEVLLDLQQVALDADGLRLHARPRPGRSRRPRPVTLEDVTLGPSGPTHLSLRTDDAESLTVPLAWARSARASGALHALSLSPALAARLGPAAVQQLHAIDLIALPTA